MTGIRVSRRGDQLIAVKSADAAGAARLRREAEILAGIEHPGVVRLLDHHEGDPAELHTAYVGTDTWTRTPPTSPDSLAEAFASLADTVADLHEHGISHGAIRAEHILVGPDQRPVLCGFADAGQADPQSELADHGALADLLCALAVSMPDARRPEFDALSRHTASGELSARTLAAALREAVQPADRTKGAAHRRSNATRVAVGAVAAATVAVAALSLWPTPDSEPADASTTTAAVPTTAAAPTTAPPSTTPPSTTVTPVPTSPINTSSTTTPGVVDAVGAVEIEHAGRRYALGRDGDVVVLGDWNCDGTPTPALLQVASETVSVFASWPDVGGDIPASATLPSPGAFGLDAVPHGDCHQLRILEPDGSRLFTPEF